MRYNEFREKFVKDFIEFTSTGITRDEIERCCNLFGMLSSILSAPDEIKDEDVLEMFIQGYAVAKVIKVIKITIPKKST